MNYHKYFSDTRRLLAFVLEIIHSHIIPHRVVAEVWARCNNIKEPRMYEPHFLRIMDTLTKFQEVLDRFIRLMIHYDKCVFEEKVVNIKAEMATIYRLAEDAGIYFGSTAYWTHTDVLPMTSKDHYVPENELSYGKLIQLLTITWKSLLNAFDISDQDDPPGYKYLGICKCGDYYVKVRSSQLFCSKSCAQNERYQRYKNKKKGKKQWKNQ